MSDLPQDPPAAPLDASARAPVPARRSAPVRLSPSVWEAWDDEKLLDLRLCDLDLRIKGTVLEERIEALYGELGARGLRFRPHFWLSDEWFCPDGVPGIAIPFYLAHPRLARLEQHQMLEVEGGTPEWCAKILRHEAGHALENAYRAAPAPRAASASSAARRSAIRSTTLRGPTARASSCISTPGTRRAIPTRTSPRPSRSG